jgi:NAD(P)-dependent dehydrogenase (short-subunit alcohol dehydrogenase family)
MHQVALKRTLTALAFTSPSAAYGGVRAGFAVSSVTAGTKYSRSRNRLFSSSSFNAPEPPQSMGVNVYNDIDFSVSTGQSSQSSIRNSDPDAVFVINGASRGIGLQFLRKLLKDTKGNIVACCRSPDDAIGLQEILLSLEGSKSRDRIDLIKLDIENQDSIEQAVLEIERKYNRVDLLLNVAGILGDGKNTPGPERSLLKIEKGWLEKSFQVNVIGPLMLSKELAPLMTQKRRTTKKKASNNDNEELIVEKKRPVAIIANLSARVGSISDNFLGGWYSYRMSKAALNQATRTLANELKRESVWCVALHPGTTDTDLSAPFQKNVQEGRLFPVEFTVDSLMKVIDSMEEENTGGLYDWAGKAIPF